MTSVFCHQFLTSNTSSGFLFWHSDQRITSKLRTICGLLYEIIFILRQG